MQASAANSLAPLVSSVGDAISIGKEQAFGLGKKQVSVDQATTAGKDFESMFLSQMMESMFGDSTGTDSFGDEDTNEVYRGMMMNEYGKAITQSGGIGIADYVKTELLKTQEV